MEDKPKFTEVLFLPNVHVTTPSSLLRSFRQVSFCAHDSLFILNTEGLGITGCLEYTAWDGNTAWNIILFKFEKKKDKKYHTDCMFKLSGSRTSTVKGTEGTKPTGTSGKESPECLVQRRSTCLYTRLRKHIVLLLENAWAYQPAVYATY